MDSKIGISNKDHHHSFNPTDTMRDPPKEEISRWPGGNFENPTYLGQTLVIVGSVFIVLSTVTVFLRLFVRTRMLCSAGIDDWLILAALFPAVAMTICAFIGTHYGWGRHIWDIPVRWYGPSLKVSYLTQIIFIIATTLIKLSICFSYRRISIDKSFHRILKYTTFTVLLYGVSFMVALVFRCWPINAYWSTLSAVRSGQCFNENAVLLLSSGINFVIDIWLVVLPVPSLWRLQLPMKQRTILVFLMSLGFVACVASIVRYYYLYYTLIQTYDVTWHGYCVWVWTTVEVDLFIISSSIPPLRPLVKR
ncbi:hypothetical protein FPQ18DRAFT_123911 [Pyronema domesticum]|nr:hypothetical protein FPQ18DRAFT_123911 [Pyronema domesticum]